MGCWGYHTTPKLNHQATYPSFPAYTPAGQESSFPQYPNPNGFLAMGGGAYPPSPSGAGGHPTPGGYLDPGGRSGVYSQETHQPILEVKALRSYVMEQAFLVIPQALTQFYGVDQPRSQYHVASLEDRWLRSIPENHSLP